MIGHAQLLKHSWSARRQHRKDAHGCIPGHSIEHVEVRHRARRVIEGPDDASDDDQGRDRMRTVNNADLEWLSGQVRARLVGVVLEQSEALFERRLALKKLFWAARALVEKGE